MDARRFVLVAAAGVAASALGPVPAGAAAAAATYDPEARTGFVAGRDVRDAFGWTDATLVARAPGVEFGHEFWTTDTYAVACGGEAFPVPHQREFGRFELAAVVVRETGRAPATGYRGRLAGFRLTGARSGISGTAVPPAAGQPCPRAEGPGPVIGEVRLTSTETGWALTAGADGTRRELLRSVTAAATGPRRSAAPR